MNYEFAHFLLLHLGAGLATAASFGFGLLSGMFIGRALWVWSQRSPQSVFNRVFNCA